VSRRAARGKGPGSSQLLGLVACCAEFDLLVDTLDMILRLAGLSAPGRQAGGNAAVRLAQPQPHPQCLQGLEAALMGRHSRREAMMSCDAADSSPISMTVIPMPRRPR